MIHRAKDKRFRNWFYDLFTRSMDPNETDYASFTYPSNASPFFPAMERFNQLDWPIQKERIVTFARRWRGRVILDATGIGDPIYDDLKRGLPDIEGYKLTPMSKVNLVQRLAVAVEQRRVSWPEVAVQGSGFGVQGEDSHRATEGTEGAEGNSDRIAGIVGSGAATEWQTLTAEMKRYEYEIGPTGNVCYAAPSGYHDDCVMALALANHGRWEMETCGNIARIAVGSGGFGWRRRRRGEDERALLGQSWRRGTAR